MKLIAHRGYSQIAPENTISSIKAAMEAGCDGIELDLRLTKDSIPIVFHDTRLNRTTDGHGKISNSTLKEIKSLDAGSWFSPKYIGETIPTLEEVLNTIGNKTKLYLEIKQNDNGSEMLIKKTIKILEKYGSVNNVEIISYYDKNLKVTRTLDKRIRLRKLVFFCINNFPIWIDKTVRFSKLSELDFVDAINVDYFVNDRLIDYVHSFGKDISVGSCPSIDKNKFSRLEEKGVDGIFRNDLKPYLNY